MKKEYLSAVILLLIFFAFFACNKEEEIVPPKVETASVDEIYNTSARVGGRVADNGGAEITERGVYWGTSTQPEISGTKLQVGTGIGTFYENLTGLTSGVKYYVKAYAINSTGTYYGDETFFTTQIHLPTINTSAVTEVTPNTAVVGGNVSDNGGFEITQTGIYWGTEPDPRLTGTKLVIGSGDGAFTHTLTGLSRALSYYVVAFATNIKGTAYGDEVNFSTVPVVPTVFTTSIIDITPYSAKVGGNISSSGGSEITERGVYWGQTPDPLATGTKLIIGNGVGSFIDTLINLNPAENYFVRAYAINNIGTSYGEEKNFTTPGEQPIAYNLDFKDLTADGIALYGLVSANDLSTTVTFQYVIDTQIDTTYVVVDGPITENNDSVNIILTGLQSLTLYHYRIKAENDLGVVYSADSTFTTVITGIEGVVIDSEGNSYQTIGIGYQEWMTENLKSVVFNNGTDSIPKVNADTSWAKLVTPAYCWYDNNEGNKDVYGALYNWYTASSGQLCPTGWHVPENEDFTEMVEYLGGAGVAGGLLKEVGTSHWNSPNTGASDRYSFTALAAGKRLSDGVFDFVKVEANWWSSTEYSTLNGSILSILFNYGNSFQAYSSKKNGMSVRCVKD